MLVHRARDIGGPGVNVTTKAIDSIRAMIGSCGLGPGDRLPPEHELAEVLEDDEA